METMEEEFNLGKEKLGMNLELEEIVEDIPDKFSDSRAVFWLTSENMVENNPDMILEMVLNNKKEGISKIIVRERYGKIIESE